MSLLKQGRPYSKPLDTAEVVFRCLGVCIFFVFIFVVVPRLGPNGFHDCKSAAHKDLETLDDLRAFLQLQAEEHAQDAEKAKHLLSLAQQIGSSTSTPSTNASQPSVGNATSASLAQMLARSQADLAAAKKVIQKHEQLLQSQLQQVAALKAQVQQQQPSQQQAAGCATAASDAALHALAVAGEACGVLPGVEWGGDVVAWGEHHKTATAAACCAACVAHSRAIARGVGSDKGPGERKPCNVWVYCSDAAACGSSYQECWLKNDAQATAARAAAAAAAAASKGPAAGGSMWTSGIPTAGQPVAAWQAQQLSNSVMVWTTALGQIRVQLLPDLAPGSVRELLRLGALLTAGGGSSGQCSNCRIYRAEPGFLVQGIVEAPGGYVAVPRNPNPPQRSVMQRGLVCWAGGGGGPDWFVNLIDQSGFGDSHLCFGQVDAAGMAVFERIALLPGKPRADSSEMAMLQQDVRFNYTLEAHAASSGGAG